MIKMTDEYLHSEIKSAKKYLKLLNLLLKLNEEGRREVFIYLVGLSHISEYREKPEGEKYEINIKRIDCNKKRTPGN